MQVPDVEGPSNRFLVIYHHAGRACGHGAGPGQPGCRQIRRSDFLRHLQCVSPQPAWNPILPACERLRWWQPIWRASAAICRRCNSDEHRHWERGKPPWASPPDLQRPGRRDRISRNRMRLRVCRPRAMPTVPHRSPRSSFQNNPNRPLEIQDRGGRRKAGSLCFRQMPIRVRRDPSQPPVGGCLCPPISRNDDTLNNQPVSWRPRVPWASLAQQPSVPIPKFISSCGKVFYEFRNRDTSKPLILVWLWFRSPHLGLAERMMRTSEPPH